MRLPKFLATAIPALLLVGCTSELPATGIDPARSDRAETGFFSIDNVGFSFSLFVPETITVRSRGHGATEQAAVESALIASVQEAMGVLIVSEITVKNDQVVSDLAAAYSSGVVKKFRKINCTGVDEVECLIEATVMPWAIRNKFAARNPKSEIDAASLYGEYLTMQHVQEQRRRLAAYYFSKVFEIGYGAELKKFELVSSANARATYKLRYAVTWNEEFREEFIGFLRKLEGDTGGKGNRTKREVEEFFFGQVLDKRLKPDEFIIRWGNWDSIFGSQYAFIKTHDPLLTEIIKRWQYTVLRFEIAPLGQCLEYRPGAKLMTEYLPDQEVEISVAPDRLKSLDTLSIQPGCSKS